MNGFSKLLVCASLLSVAQFAHATAAQEAALNCTIQWMETYRGVSRDQVFQQLQSSSITLAGPSLMHYRIIVGKCLTQNGWRVGDMNQVGHPQEGTSLMTVIGQVAAITRR